MLKLGLRTDPQTVAAFARKLVPLASRTTGWIFASIPVHEEFTFFDSGCCVLSSGLPAPRTGEVGAGGAFVQSSAPLPYATGGNVANIDGEAIWVCAGAPKRESSASADCGKR